jgi:glutathione S-transferase
MRGVLHDFPLDDEGYKVRLGLAVMGIAHQRVAVDVTPGREHRSVAFRALNPLARLPLWREGALALRGPQAILWRLAEAHARDFLPDSAEDRARLLDWLGFAVHEMWAAREARQESLFGEGVAPALFEKARRAIVLLDDHLAEPALDGAARVVGRRASIADLALFTPAALTRDRGLAPDGFPDLRRWLRRVRDLPGFVRMPGVADHA